MSQRAVRGNIIPRVRRGVSRVRDVQREGPQRAVGDDDDSGPRPILFLFRRGRAIRLPSRRLAQPAIFPPPARRQRAI